MWVTGAMVQGNVVATLQSNTTLRTIDKAIGTTLLKDVPKRTRFASVGSARNLALLTRSLASLQTLMLLQGPPKQLRQSMTAPPTQLVTAHPRISLHSLKTSLHCWMNTRLTICSERKSWSLQSTPLHCQKQQDVLQKHKLSYLGRTSEGSL